MTQICIITAKKLIFWITTGAVILAIFISPRSLAQNGDDLGVFAEHDPISDLTIDYTIWSDFLNGIVYDVGFSDRRPARSSGVIRATGSRIPHNSTSRYRHEGNRIIYHLIEDDYAQAIAEIRREIEAFPELYDYTSWNKAEQLVYWMNLHNIIVIDETLSIYPQVYLNDRFYNRPVTQIMGVELSLNDIRLGIVDAYWDDPRIIYGFFSGAVGGPTIRSHAFNRRNLSRDLSKLADEYVNSLRGVESSTRRLRVSRIYFEHQRQFPDWPGDLIEHLQSIANSDVLDILDAVPDRDPVPIAYDDHVADLAGGRPCGTPVRAMRSDDIGGNGVFSMTCQPLPFTARVFVQEIRLRRIRLLGEGRVGRVTIRDLPSPDPDIDESEPRAVFNLNGESN